MRENFLNLEPLKPLEPLEPLNPNSGTTIASYLFPFMKKTLFIILGTLVLLLAGGYLYLRYGVLKSPDFETDNTASKSVLDLRPALIARLQQVVKDGTKGLYLLTIENIDPSIKDAMLNVHGVKLTVDSAVLARLDSMEMAPDNVYRVSLKHLHIDGLGLKDLLSKKDIDLRSIDILDPVIEVFISNHAYNVEEKDTLTLYEQINKALNSVAVGRINVKNATVISHRPGKKAVPTKYTGLSVMMKQLLIDSTTQFDRDRFLFAKEADIILDKYAYRTPDSLYFFNTGRINISATRNTLTAVDIELVPRHTRAKFQQVNNVRKDRLQISIPRLLLSGIDWWMLANTESLIASRADIYGGSLSDYIDKSVPAKKFKPDNYPHQALMRIDLPLAVGNVVIHDVDITYDEYNPASGQTGTVYFTNIKGNIRNLTNMPARIRENRSMTMDAKAMFMKSIPVDMELAFDLSKTKTGNFEAKVRAGAMKKETLNLLSEPLGLFHLKRANVKKVNAYLKGDNKKASANFTLLYDDLYIVPLKKDEDKNGALNKQKTIAFIANLLKIKSANPTEGNDARQFEYVVERKAYPGFFTHLWKTILFGVIKSIGAPESLAK